MALLAKLSCVGAPKHFVLRHIVASFRQKVSYSDAIENFTSELILKSHLRWSPTAKRLSAAKGDLHLVKKTTQQLLKEINAIGGIGVSSLDIRQLQDDHLNSLIKSVIEENNRQDLNYLVNECMKWTRLPSRAVNLEILDYYARTSKPNLDKYFNFCLSLETAPFLLKLFKVKLYWTEGNTDKSLQLLDEIHDVARNAGGEQWDLIACKDLFVSMIKDAVCTKSEAVLLKLIHLIETLDDASILEQVFNELFSSQWFSDQQLANDLFRRHGSLRLRLSIQTNYLTFMLLREHNVDAVYRLVELLLSHAMLHETQKVLGLLFDYQFWRKDLRTCSEIIQTCISLDIPLDPNYGRKLVMLLLSPKKPPPAVPSKTRDGQKKTPPNVQFKF